MARYFKGSPEAFKWAASMKKAKIRKAGTRTEAAFFGPGGAVQESFYTKLQQERREHPEKFIAGMPRNPGGYQGGAIIGVDDPIYNTRQKFPKYNVQVSPLSAHGSDAVKILVRRVPHFKKSDHVYHAASHADSAAKLLELYNDRIDEELDTLKREGIEAGPLISGIVSGRFNDETKDWLRQRATWITKHKTIAWLHGEASRSRMVKNPNRETLGFSSWPMLIDYLGREGWKPLGGKNVVAFSRNIGSLFQVLQKEAREWRVLYRTFLTAQASPALSLGTYSTLDHALIAANRQANDLAGTHGKNPKVTRGRERSVFDRHQLKIALDTLKMPDAMVGVMGGPNKEEAREIVKRLTGKTVNENPITVIGNPGNGHANPPKRINATVSGVLYNRCLEIRAEKTQGEHRGLWYHPFKRDSGVQILALDSGDLLIHSTVGAKLWKVD